MKNIVVVFGILAIGIIQWNTVSGFDEEELKKAADILLQKLEIQERDLAEYKEQKNTAENSFLHVKDSIESAMLKHPLIVMLKKSFGESKIEGNNARECENLYSDKFDLLVTKYERSVRDSVRTTFKIMNKNAKEMLKAITTIKLNLKYELEHELFHCKCDCPRCKITGEYAEQVDTISQMLEQFKSMADIIQGEGKRLLDDVFSNPYSPQIWKDLVLPVFNCFQEHNL